MEEAFGVTWIAPPGRSRETTAINEGRGGSLKRVMGVGLVCVFALVGCGGGASDEDQIRDRLAAFADAVEKKDPGAACDHMSPVLKERHAKQYGECPEIMGNVLVDANSKDVDALRNDVGEITIDGDSGSAEVGGEIYPVEKVDGEWYLSE